MLSGGTDTVCLGMTNPERGKIGTTQSFASRSRLISFLVNFIHVNIQF